MDKVKLTATKGKHREVLEIPLSRISIANNDIKRVLSGKLSLSKVQVVWPPLELSKSKVTLKHKLEYKLSKKQIGEIIELQYERNLKWFTDSIANLRKALKESKKLKEVVKSDLDEWKRFINKKGNT